MFPTDANPSSPQTPLPPLPDLSGPTPGKSANSGLLQSILSGIAPIKSAVEAIQTACQQIVKSGAVPGAEQVCGQIVALASSLLPMAAQNAMNPMGMGGQGGGMQMPAPPGPPQPMSGGPGGPPQQ